MTTPTVAVVGIGRWGTNLLRCFDARTDVLWACHTGSPENAARVRETHDVRLATDYDRVLADDAVDAVALATPVSTHAALARRALRADKHVFVEKPLTGDPGTAAELRALARDRDRRLFVGYVYLYDPAVRALHERTVGDGDPVVHLRADWGTFGSFDAPIEWTLLVHQLALGQHLLDAPLSDACAVERVGVRTAADLLTVTAETDGGRRLVATCDRLAGERRRSMVAVTAGGRRFEFDDGDLAVLEGDGYAPVAVPDREPLRAECAAFLEWVAGGARPPTDADLGVAVEETLALL